MNITLRFITHYPTRKRERRKMKKKSNKLNLIICAIAFVFMIFYVYFVDGFENLVNSISKINAGFLIITVFLMVVYWLMEALGVHAALNTIKKGTPFWKTLVIAILGQYFNCITPSSSGGQPMQAYYFTKFGVPLSHGMTALLSKFIVYQFVLTVYSAVILFAQFNRFVTEFAPLMALVVFGFIINTVVIIRLLMLAFFKAPVKKAANVCLKFLNKFRLFRKHYDYEEKKEELNKIIDDYHDNFVFIRSKPWLLIRMLIYTFIQLTVYFSISYVIYIGFGLSGTDYFTIISCQAFVLMISAFMPLPGALGAAEGSYSLFFKDIFKTATNSYVGISTFIWRFLTFYLPIIVGLILSLFLGKLFAIHERSVPKEEKPVELTPEEIKGDEI